MEILEIHLKYSFWSISRRFFPTSRTFAEVHFGWANWSWWWCVLRCEQPKYQNVTEHRVRPTSICPIQLLGHWRGSTEHNELVACAPSFLWTDVLVISNKMELLSLLVLRSPRSCWRRSSNVWLSSVRIPSLQLSVHWLRRGSGTKTSRKGKVNLPLSRKQLEQHRLSTSTALPKATNETGTLERET